MNQFFEGTKESALNRSKQPRRKVKPAGQLVSDTKEAAPNTPIAGFAESISPIAA
jgi:hypothetical protein